VRRDPRTRLPRPRLSLRSRSATVIKRADVWVKLIGVLVTIAAIWSGLRDTRQFNLEKQKAKYQYELEETRVNQRVTRFFRGKPPRLRAIACMAASGSEQRGEQARRRLSEPLAEALAGDL
jgi:hypothetical protein